MTSDRMYRVWHAFQLKKKEEDHLSALKEEWMKQHMEIEKNFNHNVEECQRLAQSLNDTTDELRLRTCKSAQREREVSDIYSYVNGKISHF